MLLCHSEFCAIFDSEKKREFYVVIGFCLDQVCLAAVGLVGDICRAVTIKILPACEEIMEVLLAILQVTFVEQSYE